MAHRVKKLAILGSTGSIGRQTLEVVRAFPDRFELIGLTAGKNVELLRKQLEEFPQVKLAYCEEAKSLPDNYRFLSPKMIASHPEVDMVVIATSGKAGLEPLLEAIQAGKKEIALADKEALVMAGELISSEAKKQGVKIFPIDSEHCSTWQCLVGERKEDIQKVIITASGGPFRNYSLAQMAEVTAEDALKHPNWKMGEKVTIDSATLMNKGIEIIEAHFLFGLPFEKLEAVIHPQSIVHSLIEFVDGSIKAQLSYADMRLAIQYMLTYPERWQNNNLPRLDIAELGGLNFEPIDLNRFPAFSIALEAGRKGSTYPAVLCASDEVAVNLFLNHQIGFLDIARLVEDTLAHHRGIAHPSLEEILEADRWAREYASKCVARM